jgi:hypothetical protein
VVFASRFVSLFGTLSLEISEMVREGKDLAAGRFWEGKWLQERIPDCSKAIDRPDMKLDAVLV